MKKLYKLMIGYIFLSLSAPFYPNDSNDENNQKRKIALNNLPISIFTPQTQQFNNGNAIQIATGATGATGPATPCLLNFAMLRHTQLLPDLFSGETGTFDDGLFYRITSNPTGSPSVSTPTESITMQVPGYYLIEFSYAGDQLTTDSTNSSFYAIFNLVVNGSLVEQFILSTFGIRQIWQYIIFLSEGDVVSIQAGSDVPFLGGTPPGIPPADGLIMTINWIGPCLEPT